MDLTGSGQRLMTESFEQLHWISGSIKKNNLLTSGVAVRMQAGSLRITFEADYDAESAGSRWSPVHDSCENKLQVSQKTRNYWQAVRPPAFQKTSSMTDRRTYWSTIHISSPTHSLHFRPAVLHLLTTRSTGNIASCHHPFIASYRDKLITRPVALITVPVTVLHMLWIIHRADRWAGKRPVCCSSIRAVRLNILMLVRHRTGGFSECRLLQCKQTSSNM